MNKNKQTKPPTNPQINQKLKCVSVGLAVRLGKRSYVNRSGRAV